MKTYPDPSFDSLDSGKRPDRKRAHDPSRSNGRRPGRVNRGPRQRTGPALPSSRRSQVGPGEAIARDDPPALAHLRPPARPPCDDRRPGRSDPTSATGRAPAGTQGRRRRTSSPSSSANPRAPQAQTNRLTPRRHQPSQAIRRRPRACPTRRPPSRPSPDAELPTPSGTRHTPPRCRTAPPWFDVGVFPRTELAGWFTTSRPTSRTRLLDLNQA